MELKLERRWYTSESTIGLLFVNGTLFSYVLEDVCRDLNRDGDLNDPGEKKVHGKTCIPAGRYQVIIDLSTRFKKLMPLLVNVPGFEGIRIHNGNTHEDTEGCLLVGSTRTPNFVGHSRETFERLFIHLNAVIKHEKIFITIKDLPKP